MEQASGLSASIRGSTESDTFDLAGQAPSTVTANITRAFRDPFPIDDMIRITFVTGAGKLGRQKYDEGCAKAVTSSLRSLGFEEDRASSCVRECAGTFKLQHDTGKNLKTVVVFPRIREVVVVVGDGADNDDDNGEGGDDGSSVLLKRGSPEEMIALSTVAMFSNLVTNRCRSWSQKKGCTAAITDIQKLVSDLEGRLLEGVVLDDDEQALYDTVSVDDLKEKHAIVREAMQKQVETDGNVTSEEKAQLSAQVSDRLETIEADLEAATEQKKPKRAEKLAAMKSKAEQRKATLEKIVPKSPAPLKFHKEILALRRELVPLDKLEESARGRLLSVKETKTLARKDEILEEISDLEGKSRGWFEDDASFDLRVRAGKQQAAKSGAGGGGGKKTGSGGGALKKSGGGSAWVNSSSSLSSRPVRSSKKTATAKKKKKAGGGGGVFAAMMMDDSDSD
eukprot:CAMPEP_0197180976 /NCGR_PEP_ID=MMETSP1423-20130617/5399_1 /TAXON_ID=476441 /ORGANISM="Pseudo-nitzschia heimii, Strain UNC1101" /LENGTH=451 /DNA_ID=CAMNT_0042631129 /DNA_START=102 /DNA_END=1457 /DNA_ORIENTATION=-